MKLVLDTHILLWWVNGDPIPEITLKTINECPQKYISAISAWEIFMLVEKEKIKISLPVGAWLGRSLGQYNIETLPISNSICFKAIQLSWPHKDPADRFIMATALDAGAQLATADKKIIEADAVECV